MISFCCLQIVKIKIKYKGSFMKIKAYILVGLFFSIIGFIFSIVIINMSHTEFIKHGDLFFDWTYSALVAGLSSIVGITVLKIFTWK